VATTGAGTAGGGAGAATGEEPAATGEDPAAGADAAADAEAAEEGAAGFDTGGLVADPGEADGTRGVMLGAPGFAATLGAAGAPGFGTDAFTSERVGLREASGAGGRGGGPTRLGAGGAPPLAEAGGAASPARLVVGDGAGVPGVDGGDGGSEDTTMVAGALGTAGSGAPPSSGATVTGAGGISLSGMM
jgi:hypothetical protein